jgi:hypothetical protein
MLTRRAAPRTPALTELRAAFTAIPRIIAAKLTPTSTLLKPTGIAFGTIGKSLHEVAISGATNASGPPLTVTLGLPIAAEPWLPG